MTIYSPQMLNTFRECPVKYYFCYEKHVSVPQLEKSFSIGKNIHALASYYLKGEDISMFTLTEKETGMWNNLMSSEFFKLQPYKVESSVAAKIDDFWIGGRLDALMKNENDEYFILDYKTGDIPKDAKHDFQTIIYLLCCDRLLKEYKSLSFTYISVKTGKTESIKFSKELKEEYEKKLNDIMGQIKKFSKPNIIHKEMCKICPYLKICI